MKQKTYSYAVERKAVYLLSTGDGEGYYKIGVASDPERRMKTLQSGMPFRLMLLHFVFLEQSQHAFAIEDALQAFCHKERVRGEWFRNINVPAVINRMKELARYYND